MEIADYVVCSIDDYEGHHKKHFKLESSLLHACVALDGTASKFYPDKGVRSRFIQIISEYYWLIEPMLAIGINLRETIFEPIDLGSHEPNFAQIIYEIFRCNLAHGDNIPLGFEIEFTENDQWRSAIIGKEKFVLPDTLTFALLSVVVFSEVNSEQRIGNEDYYLTHDQRKFVIDEYWGKEEVVLDYFQSVDLPSVKLEF